MEPMTVRELLAATDGKLLGDVSLDTTISGVETDSRAVHDGDLFVAIRGENIDGHQFITGALEGGALGCLTAVPPKEAVPGKFYVLVEDTVQALGQVARAYKAKFPIPVIGITGSVGKTTTKDMIASVLSQKFRVLKTEEPEYVERPPEVDTSDPLTIRHEDDVWIVEGPWLQKIMANVNFSNYESRNWFDRMLRSAGLFDRLEEMGIKDGDLVSLYNLDFEYQR